MKKLLVILVLGLGVLVSGGGEVGAKIVSQGDYRCSTNLSADFIYLKDSHYILKGDFCPFGGCNVYNMVDKAIHNESDSCTRIYGAREGTAFYDCCNYKTNTILQYQRYDAKSLCTDDSPYNGYITINEGCSLDTQLYSYTIKPGNHVYSCCTNSAPLPVPAEPVPTTSVKKCTDVFPDSKYKVGDSKEDIEAGIKTMNYVCPDNNQAAYGDVVECASGGKTVKAMGYKCIKATYTFKSCSPSTNGKGVQVNWSYKLYASGEVLFDDEIFSCKDGIVDISSSANDSLKTMFAINKAKIDGCCTADAGDDGTGTTPPSDTPGTPSTPSTPPADTPTTPSAETPVETPVLTNENRLITEGLIKSWEEGCGLTSIQLYNYESSIKTFWAYDLYANGAKYYLKDEKNVGKDKLIADAKAHAAARAGTSAENCGLCKAEMTNHGVKGATPERCGMGEGDRFYKTDCMRVWCTNEASDGSVPSMEEPTFEGDCDPRNGESYGTAQRNEESNDAEGQTGEIEVAAEQDGEEITDDRQCKEYFICMGSDPTMQDKPTVIRAGYTSKAACESSDLLKAAMSWKGGSTGVFDQCYETEEDADLACNQYLYYCNPNDQLTTDPGKMVYVDENGQINDEGAGTKTRVEKTSNVYTKDAEGMETCSKNLPRFRDWYTEEQRQQSYQQNYRPKDIDQCYDTPDKALAVCDPNITCEGGDICLVSDQCTKPDPDCVDEETLQCKNDGTLVRGETSLTCEEAKKEEDLTAENQKVVEKCCDGSGDEEGDEDGDGEGGDDEGDDSDVTCDDEYDDSDGVDDDKNGDNDNDYDDGGSDENANLEFTVNKTDRTDESCVENITWKVHVFVKGPKLIRAKKTFVNDEGETETREEKVGELEECSVNSTELKLPETAAAGVTPASTATEVTVDVPTADEFYASYGQKGLESIGPLDGRVTTGNANNAFESRQDATGEKICVADWTKLVDPTGIKGMDSRYGFGGSNGHWIMSEGNAVEAGWILNKDTCRFECATGEDGGKLCYTEVCKNGDECEEGSNKGVVLTPEFNFVPDLRLVIYGDEEFSAQSQDEGQCAPRQTAVMTEVKDEVPSAPSTETAEGTVFNFKINDADFNPVELAPEKSILHKLVLGENLIGEANYNRYTMSYTMENQAEESMMESASYFSCMCPSKAGGGDDCAYVDVQPATNRDVCLTKRIYVGERDCFASAWWQVAGGNVYAQSGIMDRVPTNAVTDACKYSQAQCLNVGEENPYLATMKYTNGATYQDILVSKNAAENCTARMIRGLGACQGSSNSAGVALVNGASVTGQTDELLNKIEAVNDKDGNVDLSARDGLAKRVTGRNSSQGITPTAEDGSKIGAAGSRVAADEAKTTAGFNPAVEDFNFLLNSRLAAYVGYDDKPLTRDNLKKLNGTPSFGADYHAWLVNSCSAIKYQTGGGNVEDWICYVEGDLSLSADKNPLYIRAWDNGGNKVFQKVTVFVTGDVKLFSEEAVTGQMKYGTNDAVTAVDQGNFLAIIADGDIIIDANVGIEMPNPTASGAESNVDMGLVGKCWESQTATVNEAAYGSAINSTLASTPQGVGSTEGLFMADGTITVDAYQDLSNCGENTIWTDKQYIHQGMMIAWSQLNLYRDFNNRERGCQDDIYGVYNNRVPTESFIYRPDLAVNAPNWMRSAIVMTNTGN